MPHNQDIITFLSQATAEQLRMASLISDNKHGMDDPELQKKVKQVVDVTGREEEEAIVALHDCDNDPNRAINMLLEGGNDQVRTLSMSLYCKY